MSMVTEDDIARRLNQRIRYRLHDNMKRGLVSNTQESWERTKDVIREEVIRAREELKNL